MAGESLVEKVYRKVKQEIKDGNITSKDCIVENDICKRYDVSKATAGGVLHRLTQEGLMKSYPRKGYMLNVYSEEDFTKIQNLRFAIETLVVHKLVNEVDSGKVRKAFHNLNQMDNIAFHNNMAKLLEDSFIEETLDNLLTKASNTFDHIDFDDGADKVINERHQNLIDAIIEGDEAKAMDALRNDLRLNNLSNPEGIFGQWEMRKSFNTNTMKEIAFISDPQISADEKYAALTVYRSNPEDGTFSSVIELIDLRSGQIEKVFDQGSCKSPRFTAQGHTITYLSDKTGEFQIYISDKTGESVQLTTLRHGIRNYHGSAEHGCFVFEAALWDEEVKAGTCFLEMAPDEKEAWKQEQLFAPKVITQIDYKRDEWKGVSDGSITCIGTTDMNGGQKLLTGDRPYSMPVLSNDGSRIACYGQPHTGAKFSKKELFIMNKDGSSQTCLTDGLSLAGDVPVSFTEDDTRIVFPAYYMEEGNMILYLYMIGSNGKEAVCLFDPKAPEVSSGVYAMPVMRTQYGREKSYFSIEGEHAYFLCAWQGTERLYKIALKEKSVPKLILDGDFSIHEFCNPANKSILLTRADFYSLRELYLYHNKTKRFVKIMEHNSWLREYNLGRVKTMDIPSKDGKAVIHGAVCKPVNFEKGRKYPAVLYVHGGPRVSYTNDCWHEMHALVNAGYAVITCDPRGSFGYGLKFSNSGDSWDMPAYEDLMEFLDQTIALGYIDETKVGITGGSYGGYMTSKIIMMTDRFAAAVGQRIFVNKATSYGTGDMGFYSASQDWSTVNVQKSLVERARTSIIKDVDKISTPTLLLHGYRDYRCSFEQAEQLFIAVKQRRKEVPVKLVMYPDENHEITRSGALHFQQSHLQEMIDWFDIYLKGADNE